MTMIINSGLAKVIIALLITATVLIVIDLLYMIKDSKKERK